MNRTEERDMAIKALKTRTENGLLALSQAIGGYRGVVEAMHAELVRKDARIKELEETLDDSWLLTERAEPCDRARAHRVLEGVK